MRKIKVEEVEVNGEKWLFGSVELGPPRNKDIVTWMGRDEKEFQMAFVESMEDYFNFSQELDDRNI